MLSSKVGETVAAELQAHNTVIFNQMLTCLEIYKYLLALFGSEPNTCILQTSYKHSHLKTNIHTNIQ